MKIVPISLEVEYWKMGDNNYHTFLFSLLNFEWSVGRSGDTSLLQIGWNQGDFIFETFFFWWISDRISVLKERIEDKKLE